MYEATLAFELERRGLRVLTQQGVPVIWEDVKLDVGFRPDIIINDKVIIEIKSIEAIALCTERFLKHICDLRDCILDY